MRGSEVPGENLCGLRLSIIPKTAVCFAIGRGNRQMGVMFAAARDESPGSRIEYAQPFPHHPMLRGIVTNCNLI
jgi:hypothetical protein